MSMVTFIAMSIQPSLAQGEVGTGPAFNNPRGTGQTANGDLVVADFGTGDIIIVDIITGDRTLLSDASDASQGPLLVQPAGTIVLPGDRIFVTDCLWALFLRLIHIPASVNSSQVEMVQSWLRLD